MSYSSHWIFSVVDQRQLALDTDLLKQWLSSPNGVFRKRFGLWGALRLVAKPEERLRLQGRSDQNGRIALCDADSAYWYQSRFNWPGLSSSYWDSDRNDGKFYLLAKIVEGFACLRTPKYDVSLGKDGKLHVFERRYGWLNPNPARVEIHNKIERERIISKMAQHVRGVQPRFSHALETEIVTRRNTTIGGWFFWLGLISVVLGSILLASGLGAIAGIVLIAVGAAAVGAGLGVNLTSVFSRKVAVPASGERLLDVPVERVVERRVEVPVEVAGHQASCPHVADAADAADAADLAGPWPSSSSASRGRRDEDVGVALGSDGMTVCGSPFNTCEPPPQPRSGPSLVGTPVYYQHAPLSSRAPYPDPSAARRRRRGDEDVSHEPSTMAGHIPAPLGGERPRG